MSQSWTHFHELFIGSIEGNTNYLNLTTSLWNMLILITTSNYPDIMLPSYSVNGAWFFFFAFLFFLVCFLLASQLV